MTTRSSPIQVLKAQADMMARKIKASGKDELRAAVVMDDKTLVLDLKDVRSMPEKEIARGILNLMQEL